MLTRKDWIGIAVGAAVVGGLVFAGEALTGDQFTRLEDLRKRIASAVTPAAAADLAAKKRTIKKMKSDAVRWVKILAAAEKVFPKRASATVTNVDLAAIVSTTSANLVRCDKGPSTELSWTPPPPAEGSGDESGESDPAASMVKYTEDVLNVTVRGNFVSWLKILAGLDQLGKYYRFKDLSMTSTLGTRTDQPPLTIDMQLASYRVTEFPSDRKPAESSGE